jgi:hypothetical protein
MILLFTEIMLLEYRRHPSGWVEGISTILNVLLMYKVTNIRFFSHSLNDKSLQVTEIHDLNNGRSNILKLCQE